jgi:hypothetical protein
MNEPLKSTAFWADRFDQQPRHHLCLSRLNDASSPKKELAVNTSQVVSGVIIIAKILEKHDRSSRKVDKLSGGKNLQDHHYKQFQKSTSEQGVL